MLRLAFTLRASPWLGPPTSNHVAPSMYSYLTLLFDVDNDCVVITSQYALQERRTPLRRIGDDITHMLWRICDVIRHKTSLNGFIK